MGRFVDSEQSMQSDRAPHRSDGTECRASRTVSRSRTGPVDSSGLGALSLHIILFRRLHEASRTHNTSVKQLKVVNACNPCCMYRSQQSAINSAVNSPLRPQQSRAVCRFAARASGFSSAIHIRQGAWPAPEPTAAPARLYVSREDQPAGATYRPVLALLCVTSLYARTSTMSSAYLAGDAL